MEKYVIVDFLDFLNGKENILAGPYNNKNTAKEIAIKDLDGWYGRATVCTIKRLNEVVTEKMLNGIVQIKKNDPKPVAFE